MSAELSPPTLRQRNISGNLITRHWRGGYSLAVSYWVINFLANMAIVAFVTFLAVVIVPDRGFEPLAIFLFISALWIGAGLVLVWQIVGLWRSAQRHAQERRGMGRTVFWARAAQAMAVIVVVQTVAAYANTGGPQLNELYRIAFLNDPDIAANELTLLDGGRELRLVGGIKYGLARDIQTILKAAPNTTVLHLDSAGGRIGEAQKIFDLVRT
jgi:hypothetical protein